MPAFPRLRSGAVAQFPLQSNSTARVITNEYLDGSAVWQYDRGSGRRRWTMEYQALTGPEKESIVAFFDSCAGRMKTFVFCDPLDNLLADSSDPSSPQWLRSSSVEALAGLDDPRGGSDAFRFSNGAQTEGSILQDPGEVGEGHFCGSVWVRGNGVPARLHLQSGQDTSEVEVVTTPTWQRAWVTVDSTGTCSMALALPPGGTVDVFGLQLEAQSAPSAYKVTTGPGGIYRNARFDQDQLRWVEAELGLFQCRVVIEARMPG